VADKNKFPAEVLTPEGEVFNGEVEMLSTRTSVGEVGLLANHAPLLATLEPAELRLHRSESDVDRYAQAEGYLQVFENHVLVLVEECLEVDRIDRDQQRERLRRAEEVLARIDQEALLKRVREARTTAERDEARQLTAEHDKALTDKKRAETFLRLTGDLPAT
jgi:F-type H+-transporting ATPase subunit epsilon